MENIIYSLRKYGALKFQQKHTAEQYQAKFLKEGITTTKRKEGWYWIVEEGSTK